jgi:hypothetical protein
LRAGACQTVDEAINVAKQARQFLNQLHHYLQDYLL